MTFRKLYIIGNGFDLWHEIPSRLGDFKEYVEGTDRDVYRGVEEYLPTQEDWSDLERSLADLDVDSLIDNHSHFASSYGADDWSDSAHHDFQYEVENIVRHLSRDLRGNFAEWIRNLPIPTPATAQMRLKTLDTDALFFNFNYTSTLGSLYGVPDKQILFIHGRADLATDELVLGHAWNPQARKPVNNRFHIQDLEDMDPRLLEVHQIIDGYFSATFKRSDELIEQNQGFFDALTSIEQVVVLGHSLSDVDAAYFSALLRQPSVARATWSIACRSQKEWAEKQAHINRLGLNPNNTFQVAWDGA